MDGRQGVVIATSAIDLIDLTDPTSDRMLYEQFQSRHITKVGFRREGPCDGFSDSNPSWAPLLSTLRGRFQTTIQSQMARTWRREFRPEHAFVRIKMLFLERVTTSSREHAKDEI